MLSPSTLIALALALLSGCAARLHELQPGGGHRARLPQPRADAAQLVVDRIGRSWAAHTEIIYIVVTAPSGRDSTFMAPWARDVTFEIPAGQEVEVAYSVFECAWFAPCEPPPTPRIRQALHRCSMRVVGRPGELLHIVAHVEPWRRRCRFQSISPVEEVSRESDPTELEVVFERSRPGSAGSLSAVLRYESGPQVTGWLTPALIPEGVLGFRVFVSLHALSQRFTLHVVTAEGREEFHKTSVHEGVRTRLTIPVSGGAVPARRVDPKVLRESTVAVPP